MMAAKPLLTAENLALRRGERLLFQQIGFTLSPGELLLLRGPNGAGKSSLLGVLSGLLQPTDGKVEWASEAPPHVLGHLSGVKTRLTLAENLDFWASVNGRTGIAVGAALETVGLGGLDGIEAGHLSAGQTRRLGLARLLVTDRLVWLLDEPTASLDARGDGLVAGLIAQRLATGGAVMAATHHDIAGVTGTLMLGAAP